MIKLYSYFIVTETIVGFGEIRRDLTAEEETEHVDNYDPKNASMKLSDFGYYEEDIKEDVDNNENFRNGDGYGYILYRTTSFYTDETERVEARDPVTEAVDNIEYFKNLPKYLVRRYVDEDGETIKEVKTESRETPEEEEARKESGVSEGYLECCVIETYDGAKEDEEDQINSDYYGD